MPCWDPVGVLLGARWGLWGGDSGSGWGLGSSCEALPRPAWPPLPADGGALDKAVERVFQNMTPSEENDVLAYCRDSGFLKWSSACSGSEAPGWTIDALERCYSH